MDKVNSITENSIKENNEINVLFSIGIPILVISIILFIFLYNWKSFIIIASILLVGGLITIGFGVSKLQNNNPIKITTSMSTIIDGILSIFILNIFTNVTSEIAWPIKLFTGIYIINKFIEPVIQIIKTIQFETAQQYNWTIITYDVLSILEKLLLNIGVIVVISLFIMKYGKIPKKVVIFAIIYIIVKNSKIIMEMLNKNAKEGDIQRIIYNNLQKNIS